MSEQVRSDEIPLKELISQIKEWSTYLLSKWMVILVFGVIGAALGFAYSFTKKPVYTASLSFVLEDDQTGGGLGGVFGLASQFGFDIGGSNGGIFTGANLIELFKSRTMVEQTLLTPITNNGEIISFAEMYIQNVGWRDKWAKKGVLKNTQFPPNADRQHFSRQQDSIMGVIYNALSKNGLKVEQKDKRVDIITIDIESTNENFAKYFAEALAKVVSDFYILTRSKKARMNMAILEKQTDSIRRELNSAISGVAIATDNTFNLNPALNIRRAPSARRQVDVQANTAILTELVKQTEIAKVTVRQETPLIQVVDKPIFPLKKVKFGKLKGLVLGGFLSGICILFVLIIRRFLGK